MEAVPSEKSSPPFGRYLIRERIAEGGMGEVFVAVAVGADGFEKPVVIKRLLPKFAGRPEVANLLSSEAKLMTRLVHPNIVQVIDFGRGENDDYFLVMELVSGTDLGRFCDSYRANGKAVPVELALYVMTQVLRGLAHAHASASADGKRLVHRDISPGNVLVSTFGEVKVADFGVALVASTTEGESHDGWFVGKPAYMAPEQLERAPVDERADIYGVGAVLFHVLTGTSHRSESIPGDDATLRSEISFEAREAIARVASPDLAAVILRALAPLRDARYANARAMARAIEELVEKGEKIATADDLASAVSELVRRQPSRGRSVVVLSAGDQELAAGTELTHLGARGGSQGFTVKIQDPPAGRAPFASTDDEPARRQARLSRIGLAVVGALAAVTGFILFLHRTPAPGSASRNVAAPAQSASSALLPVDSSEPPPAAAESAIVSPGESWLRSAHPSRASAAISHHREAPATAGKEPAASREPAPPCRGQIYLYASHGWVISGGSGTVQAPGRYEWPCGTYALRAVSRLDARDVRTMSVTVRETTPGVVDLR
jgi:eukaryotic-like serine/threonine-protein kinase